MASRREQRCGCVDRNRSGRGWHYSTLADAFVNYPNEFIQMQHRSRSTEILRWACQKSRRPSLPVLPLS